MQIQGKQIHHTVKKKKSAQTQEKQTPQIILKKITFITYRTRKGKKSTFLKNSHL